MPYIINKYDGSELTVLEDGSINNSTSLGLIGRNYFGYGEQQNENFVFLLENFANPNPPLRPVKGQSWFDTTEGLLKVYDGTSWSVVGSAVVSETAPTTVTIGSLWLKTPVNVLYVYNGNTWTFVGPETAEGFGETRAESTTLLDSQDIEHPVILFKVNDKITAIASDTSFTLNPGVVLDGFANISAGITISSSMNFNGSLNGLSSRATQLQTTRLINGVGFNGTADITIKASTTNNLTPGEYINGGLFNGASPETWNVDASSSNEPNKLVVRDSLGDFSARNITAENITADLTGNVTATEGVSSFRICRAEKFEGATLTGNADTATRLKTPRNINGVLFSGVEDIEVSASAETLTGTFIKSSVVSSNLQQVGILQNLSVQKPGITVGNSQDKLQIAILNSGAAVYSNTGKLRIGANGNPEFNFLDAVTAESEGGPAGYSTLSPIGNSNLGLPNNKFDTVYADQLEGNSATATLSSTAVNLSGGSQGSIVYQTNIGTTDYLPAGTPGYVLKAAVNNQLEWSPIINERLNQGSYLNFQDVGSNAVGFYDTQSQVTVSVDATSSSSANKIVARDASGDFSTARITLTQTPTATNHAVTKSYVDGVVSSNVESVRLTITSGNTVYSTSGFTNIVGSWSNSRNYFDVFPPAGKSMANLIAFIPSIAVIYYNGNVNADDHMRCTWSNLGNRIRVYVQNTEQRSTPAANYLAIWS